MSKRVLIVAPSQGAWGGMEAFALNLAGYLKDHSGFKVKICLKLVGGYSLTPGLRRILDESGVENSIVARSSISLLKEIAWADIVHGQNASPDICFAAKLLNKRLVLTIHNHMHNRRGLRVAVWKSSARLANRVWFNSNFVRSSWTQQAASVKSQVVFTASEIQFDFAPIEERSGFVFVGRWIPGKGIRTLIKAYSQAGLCPKLHPLVMLGEGPILGECVELVRSNSIQGIQIRGFVSNAEKHECIRRARWLIAPPNTNEDMGLTPLEARSHGVPCIVTRDGGLEEVAGKSALTCAPGDISGLSHALKTATDMSTTEYIERSQETFNSLRSNWQGFSFYPVAYGQVLGIK